MLRKLMKSKLHRATVTRADLHYEGSLGVDEDLMRLAGLLPNEAVHVWNVNNGSRLQTYVVPAPAGSGEICLFGSAARQGQPGDLVIIAAFAWMEDEEARRFRPQVVLLEEGNRVRTERNG